MNRIHSTIAFALAVAVASAPALAQTAAPASTSPSTSRHAEIMGALKGGGIGCLAGGLLGHFILHHNALKSCAVGAAAGAVIGGVRAHQQQVKEARALRAQAEAAGATATIQTREIEAKNDAGQVQKTQALSRLTLALSASDVADHAAGTADVLARAAHLADASTDPVTLTVEGTNTERTWIAGVLRAHLRADTTATIREVPASSPTLILSPVPRVSN